MACVFIKEVVPAIFHEVAGPLDQHLLHSDIVVLYKPTTSYVVALWGQ